MASQPDFLQIPMLVIQDKQLKPLDHLVYGIVYWHTKLRLQQCKASNATLAKYINSTAGSVANSLSRLHRLGYVAIVADDKHHRAEVVPLVVYAKTDTLHQTVKPFHQPVKGGSSADEQNKNIEKETLSKERDSHISSNGDTHPYRPLVEYCREQQGMKTTFVNYPKQLAAVKRIMAAGYSADDIRFVIDEMVGDTKDPYWRDNPFDLMNVANQMHRYMNRTVYYGKGGGKR